ncbi:hypothetical protein MHL30_17560 [Priestia flexa]|uniref:hypothetical protein n=1 Tax=Priestia flexa TaxID=86664 RepID=UPI001EF4473D|nr:hypothetical protein [Priestia flexa]MCG7314929.1 hypothetical protein [Priestia flexa]
MKIGEVIDVYEHWGNNFETVRKAILYRDGTIEYLPEPEYEEGEEEIIEEEEWY